MVEHKTRSNRQKFDIYNNDQFENEEIRLSDVEALLYFFNLYFDLFLIVAEKTEQQTEA